MLDVRLQQDFRRCRFLQPLLRRRFEARASTLISALESIGSLAQQLLSQFGEENLGGPQGGGRSARLQPNYRMQRSTRPESSSLPLTLQRVPADACRWASLRITRGDDALV